MTYKICRQCGKNLPVSMFRAYGQGRKGTHRRCKSCESLNLRFKYLKRKHTLSDKELKEVDSIIEIYKELKSFGYEVPTDSISVSDRLIEYKQHIEDIKDTTVRKHSVDTEVPSELLYWLTAPLIDKPPEYYIDIVYEKLQDKYAPFTNYNADTSLPERSPVYKEQLNAILERFYEYEDTYRG